MRRRGGKASVALARHCRLPSNLKIQDYRTVPASATIATCPTVFGGTGRFGGNRGRMYGVALFFCNVVPQTHEATFPFIGDTPRFYLTLSVFSAHSVIPWSDDWLTRFVELTRAPGFPQAEVLTPFYCTITLSCRRWEACVGVY